MRFAVSIPPFASPGDLVDLAVDAERAGWDGVVWDHLHLIRALALDVNDPWVLLGAMAVRTERVSTAEFADAGATSMMVSDWPAGDWYTSLRRAIRAGPAP